MRGWDVLTTPGPFLLPVAGISPKSGSSIGSSLPLLELQLSDSDLANEFSFSVGDGPLSHSGEISVEKVSATRFFFLRFLSSLD